MIELNLGIISKENIHSVTTNKKFSKNGNVYLLLITYCKGKVFHTIEIGSEYASDRNADFETLKKEILKS